MLLVVSVCQSAYMRGVPMWPHINLFKLVQYVAYTSIGKLAVNLRLKGLLVFRVILTAIQNYVCGMIAVLLAITDLEIGNKFGFS